MIITDDNWIDFMIHFFDANAKPRWLKHVAANWNPLLNQTGCGCSFAWYRDPQYCEGYLEIQRFTGET
jgi:hypothetical protein